MAESVIFRSSAPLIEPEHVGCASIWNNNLLCSNLPVKSLDNADKYVIKGDFRQN